MAKPKVTEKEVRAARAFLHYLHGNESNTYLLLAVISWLRALTKAHDPFWKQLGRLSASAQGIALAKKLAARVKADPHNYGAIIKRLQTQERKASGLVDQAKDFMLSIEKSPWARGTYYGYKAAVEGHWETQQTGEKDDGRPIFGTVWVPPTPENDPLTLAWYKLTDHPNIPSKWFVDTVTTKKVVTTPPRPSQPRSLMHVLPTVDYIKPYAARNFYHEKPHYGENLVRGD